VSGVIHYATPAIAAAATDIAAVAARTEDNHQRSLQIVTANADHFQGVGSDAFQGAIALVNNTYQRLQETIRAAGLALGQANDGMTHADGMCAAQY
jgi:uncharacterized protein YukE